MNIVIDTNILISALIKDSITRKIIVQSGFRFYYPEISLMELKKHRNYIIKKSKISEKDFDKLLNNILEYIVTIPEDIIKLKLVKAVSIMEEIDINDSIFLAVSLALDNSLIWSNDSDFDKQKEVKVLKTKDLIKLFQK